PHPTTTAASPYTTLFRSGADRRADRKQGFLAVDPKLSDLLLQRHLRLGEMLALRLGDVLLLGFARADLERDVTVTIRGAMRNDLDRKSTRLNSSHVKISY